MNFPTVENLTYYQNYEKFEDSKIALVEIELSNLGLFVPAVNMFCECNLFSIIK